MDQPYPTPRSFRPNAPPPPPHSLSSDPCQHTLPTQTLSQQRQEQQIRENISPQSHPNAHQNHVHNGIPSEEQRAAVLALQSIPDSIFFCCLESFRSFLRGETAFYPNNLSDQQHQAFLALTGCSDELVLTLRRLSGSLASPQNFYDSSTLCNGRVTAKSLTPSSSFVSNASTHNALNFPSVQSSYDFSNYDSVGLPSSSAASSNKRKRWCFVSDNHTQLFTTVDGFKKHLREHYTQYFCIPQEALVYKEDGPRCAFCNFPNPDRVHLDTHVTECVGRKFTRKSTLISHLKKKHGVHNGSVLTGQFEYTVDQKYFACGFCVFCCGSLNDLANHVDDHHYKFSQHIRHWDYDKVIRGLLSQPVVVECWQAVLASNPPFQESWFRWMPTLVKQLKHRLEISREPAETLCNAAIDASNYRRNRYGYLGPVSADQGMVANETIEPLEHQDALSPPSFNSEQSHVAYPSYMAAVSPQLQHPARDSDRPNFMDLDEGRRYPQVTSETYSSPGSLVYRHPSYRAQLLYPSNWGESFMQGHYPACSSSPTSASGTSQASDGQARDPYHPRLGGHSSGLSPSLVINAQSGHEATTPAQAPAGWNYPASTMETASSALSRDHNISPQSQFNDTYSLRVHPPLTSHSSRRKPTHRRIIDMDSDSDDQQCLTQARGRSRRQRRDH